MHAHWLRSLAEGPLRSLYPSPGRPSLLGLAITRTSRLLPLLPKKTKVLIHD
jgi:hypothetical protein